MKRGSRLNKKREDRKKIPLKTGAYLIVTDAEKTEKNYFEGIRNTIPEALKNDLQIKIFSNKSLTKIIDFAAEERN
ncbi:MAG: RloB domain-containing protein, partial [Fusobacteriaceae bacterium]|nr:RloB domain-containing protein [Fusobacteriaceae bacterium]